MINIEYIDNIASIAKLNISEAEKEDLIEYMENILDYIEILNVFDIDNEVLMDTIERETGILRNDKVETSYDVETLLKNAHSTENGYFLVPNILI